MKTARSPNPKSHRRKRRKVSLREILIMSIDTLWNIRNQYIGFVFQQFNLLPRLTALENVMLPMIYAAVPKSARVTAATEALTKVGSIDRLKSRPSQLLGGQQQRVAIARAL